jgi:hypothetical protein
MWSTVDYEKKLRELVKSRCKLEEKLRSIGPIMRGTVTTVEKNVWSSRPGESATKGKYNLFSYYERKKPKMKSIGKHKSEVRKMIANYKELMEIVKEMTKINLGIIDIKRNIGKEEAEKVIREEEKKARMMRK